MFSKLQNYFKPAYMPDQITPKVRLKCGNMRTAFLAFNLAFSLLILMLLCQLAISAEMVEAADFAKAANAFFGKPEMMMIAPAVIIATLLYFAFERKMLIWDNGLLIDNEPVIITHYQVKQLFGTTILYLRSARRLWIVYPVTSQDNYRFKNAAIMKKEIAENAVQVKSLISLLTAAGAIENHFGFFTNSVVITFFIFLITVAAALLSLA